MDKKKKGCSLKMTRAPQSIKAKRERNYINLRMPIVNQAFRYPAAFFQAITPKRLSLMKGFTGFMDLNNFAGSTQAA
jgi:hypothetical protein